MTAEEWITAYAAAAGVPAPSPDDVAVLLELAGVAAPRVGTDCGAHHLLDCRGRRHHSR